jgi:ribonuclease Z
MQEYQPSQITQLGVLGSGTPNPDPLRSGPSFLLRVKGVPYIFDFGPGLIRRAAGFSSRYGGDWEDFELRDLSRAFLSHLHADHTAGLPDLILTPWILGREEPLQIWGPNGTEHLVEHVVAGYQSDIRYRLEGLEPASKHGWEVEVQQIESEQVYKAPGILVKAFAVSHGDMPDCFGFRIKTPDRTIVFSGDTRPCSAVIENSRNADILVHEVYSTAGFQRRTPDWQAYHKHHHTSTRELAELAAEVKPKLLLLNHILFWGTKPEDLLAEIHSGYDGQVRIAQDLAVY